MLKNNTVYQLVDRTAQFSGLVRNSLSTQEWMIRVKQYRLDSRVWYRKQKYRLQDYSWLMCPICIHGPPGTPFEVDTGGNGIDK